ncbi:MAG: DUF5050 domain-containing protein [Clostridium sp.]|nr:DUF5050 domain-containing protein [Clostridium sp.]
MKKNWKIFLIAGIILIALLVGNAVSAFMDRVPSNDISVTGNTAGNLNNGGLFAEDNGKVYFSNAYDGGRLYSMNANETELVRISPSRVNSINVGGNYLYFYMNNSEGGTGFGYVIRSYGVYRSKLDGSRLQCLDRTVSTALQLSGDYLYYQRYNNTDYTKLYKIKTDKSGQQLVSESIINPNACNNGTIYFNGTEKDHYLYALDTRTDTISTVYQGNLWYPVYHNGYIYYMDVSSNYRLCRYSLSDNVVEILTTDRVDTFNVCDFYIYYQRNSSESPALMRMELDGSNPEVVAEGNYTNINLTSSYAYFNLFGEDIPVYRTPIYGSINVTPFTAAEEAAIKMMGK